jgi:putative transposase
MWTGEHRARHAARLKEIASVQAEEEVARWLERADPPRSRGATPFVAVVRAIGWHLRVGGPWRALPAHLPPWRTVYGWFRRWLGRGLLDLLLGEIAKIRRRAAGRRSLPRLAIIDTQAVKCIAVRGPRGYDAGKQVLGRKRVALVDADGNWLAVAVVPASVQDRDTPPALNQGLSAWPSLRLAIFDGAFTADDCRAWANFHGMRHQVVSRAPDQKGFVVLPRRWVVERRLADTLGRSAAGAGRSARCCRRTARRGRRPLRSSGAAQSTINPQGRIVNQLKQALRWIYPLPIIIPPTGISFIQKRGM